MGLCSADGCRRTTPCGPFCRDDGGFDDDLRQPDALGEAGPDYKTCPCSFCGATNAINPGRVLVHDNGAAICADCVAASVLSLARYAQELIQGAPAVVATPGL